MNEYKCFTCEASQMQLSEATGDAVVLYRLISVEVCHHSKAVLAIEERMSSNEAQVFQGYHIHIVYSY